MNDTFSDFSPSAFNAPFWLRGGHTQTIYAKTLQDVAPNYRRELILDRFGGDWVAYDFVDAREADSPCVVLLHGLEGSSQSHYAIELMNTVQRVGWHGVVAHFRSCGGVPAKRLYHSGDSEEVAHMMSVLSKRYSRLFVVGVSLGGNVLAKYLGEAKTAALPRAAITVSTPFKLAEAGKRLESGLTRRLYTDYFLRSLLTKVDAKGKKIRSLGEFDNAFTAPIHGFADKDDYYAKASSFDYLREITVPTLLINAKNDPFYPASALPSTQDVSSCVQLLQPENGGHVGFVSGRRLGHLMWLPETILQFFAGFI